jgi:hypothetical protein
MSSHMDAAGTAWVLPTGARGVEGSGVRMFVLATPQQGVSMAALPPRRWGGRGGVHDFPLHMQRLPPRAPAVASSPCTGSDSDPMPPPRA